MAHDLLMFQSAPANKDGRTTPIARPAAGFILFQSAPANKDGRTGLRGHGDTFVFRFQSAPANKDGRTNEHFELNLMFQSFNPRPPIKTGEPLIVPAFVYAAIRVSIRARQ